MALWSKNKEVKTMKGKLKTITRKYLFSNEEIQQLLDVKGKLTNINLTSDGWNVLTAEEQN